MGAVTPPGAPSQRFVAFSRRHPRLMLFAVIALGCVATVLLLFKSSGTVVLYQRF